MAEEELGFVVDTGARNTAPDYHSDVAYFNIDANGHLILKDRSDNVLAAYAPGSWVKIKMGDQSSW